VQTPEDSPDCVVTEEPGREPGAPVFRAREAVKRGGPQGGGPRQLVQASQGEKMTWQR